MACDDVFREIMERNTLDWEHGFQQTRAGIMGGFDQQRAAQQNIRPQDQLGMGGLGAYYNSLWGCNPPLGGLLPGMQPSIQQQREWYGNEPGLKKHLEDLQSEKERIARDLSDMDDLHKGLSEIDPSTLLPPLQPVGGPNRFVAVDSEPVFFSDRYFKALWRRLVAHWTWIWDVGY